MKQPDFDYQKLRFRNKINGNIKMENNILLVKDNTKINISKEIIQNGGKLCLKKVFQIRNKNVY